MNFTLCAVLSSVMKYHIVPLWDVNHPFVPCLHTAESPCLIVIEKSPWYQISCHSITELMFK